MCGEGFGMAEDEESGARREYGLDRTLALSDGVFAFAITLLVLDLVVPDLAASASTQDIALALSQEAQRFVNYFVSFLVVGLWWHNHRRNFSYVRRSDSTLAWLNLFFLLWIALTPFFTNLLDQYGNIQFTVVLYALVQAAAGGFMTLIWWYASRNHLLIARNLKDSTIRYILRRNSVAPAVFLLSICLSFIMPPVTVPFSWLLMIPPLIVLQRRHQKTARAD
jgi:uncharacterized membrane protein